MSGFSAVDEAGHPERFEAYLDLTARGLSAMKNYIVAAHDVAGSDLVLDIGCGAGHDLELLAGAAIASVGLEPSAGLLGAAARRVHEHRPRAALMQARGEAIPLRDACVGGCRIERVLQHVDDPAAVLSEAVRCVRPGGLVTVFEPDWSSIRIPSATLDADASWLARVKQPGIGGALWGLLERAGCQVVDRVEELSVWTSLAVADRLVSIRTGLQEQVGGGRFTADAAAGWLAEQEALDLEGRFRLTIAKVLVCAHKN